MNRVSTPGGRAGQGRVAGLLCLWLRQGCSCNRSVHNSKEYKATLGSAGFHAAGERLRQSILTKPHYREILDAENSIGYSPREEAVVVP